MLRRPALIGTATTMCRNVVRGKCVPALTAAGNVGMSIARRAGRLCLADHRTIPTTLFLLVSALSLVAGSYVYDLWRGLPTVNSESLRAEQSVRVLDREGGELYRIVEDQDRTFLPWGSVPAYLKQAMIAVEDERFYIRGCIDVQAIARALLANARGESQGGSTITQQLVRNVYLTPEKAIERKIRELMLACKLESRMTKDEILHLYLNWIPFGRSTYGVERAAQSLFGVSARDVNLPQAAILASLPQRPTYFSPYGSHLRTEVSADALEKLKSGELTVDTLTPEDVTIGLLGADIDTGSGKVHIGGRSEQVLASMERLGYITKEERIAAEKDLDTMTFRARRDEIRAPHFVFWVRDQVDALREEAGEHGNWDRLGLNVRTTLDPKLQRAAEDAVDRLFPQTRTRYQARNMAMVAVDRTTREVVAYVGNVDFFDEEFGGKIDMARAPRQPGSSFKPFVYAAAFKTGMTPLSIVQDTLLTIGALRPKNYDGRYFGPITVKRALAGSRNIPAIRAYMQAGGEDPVLDLISAAGITTPSQRKAAIAEERGEYSYGWPVALGSAEIPLIEMVQGYSTLADSGVYRPIKSIADIEDVEGHLVYAPQQPETRRQAIDPAIAGAITTILSDENSRPAGYWKTQLHLPALQAAIKTGTSNLCLQRKKGNCVQYAVNNVWAMGYTPDLIVGVWVGNVDNSPLAPKADGLNVAIPFWKDFVLAAHNIRKDTAVFPPAPPLKNMKTKLLPQLAKY